MDGGPPAGIKPNGLAFNGNLEEETAALEACAAMMARMPQLAQPIERAGRCGQIFMAVLLSN